MLQFDNTALQEPYKTNTENALEDPSLKIISEHCNTVTSKGILLRGTLFFTAKNKGKSLPVIMYVCMIQSAHFCINKSPFDKKNLPNKTLRTHLF
jgi:hypothetical protein